MAERLPNFNPFYVVFSAFELPSDLIDLPKDILLIRCNCGHLAWMPPVANADRLDKYTYCSHCYDQMADLLASLFNANTVRMLREALERRYGTVTMEDVITQLRNLGVWSDDE